MVERGFARRSALASVRSAAGTREGALLLLLTLLMRFAVPAGFMPVAAHGAIEIVPCSGHGPMAMPGHAPGHTQKADTGECPFSALGDAGGGAAALAITPPALPAAPRRIVYAAPSIERAAVRLRPPGRAPPL